MNPLTELQELIFFTTEAVARRCSVAKKDVLKIFAKFAEEHMCQSVFFNKVAGVRPATLLRKDSGTCVFF